MKILIIDDDPLDREIFKRYLQQDASDSRTVFDEAETGRTGVERLAAFEPDCVLLDYNLPDMNGLEFISAIRNGGNRLPRPIVMLTAIGNERVAVQAMKSGVMDYTAKGTTTAESLSHTVRNAVEKFSLECLVQDQHKTLAQRNEELERARSEADTLIEAIPQIVWTADGTGEINFANARLYDYAGIKSPESSLPTWERLLHAGDEHRLIEAWKHSIKTGGVFEAAGRLRRADGIHRWHLCRAVPLFRNGIIFKWFGTCTDIEDQKTAEEALLQTQKLESVGLLAGGVAHDFNNLLVGIMGGASFALETIPRSHAAYRMLQGIVDASERAAALTRQMLAYAGKGRFIIEPVDLSDMVVHTANLVQASIPKAVQLNLQIEPKLPTIQTDAGQIQQVVMNLIINAAEAIGADCAGLVTVRTRAEQIVTDSGQLDIFKASIKPGLYAVLEVQDSGPGVDPAIVGKIFDPFFTTKFTGRGLGLAAVAGIVRSHRGAIQVDSIPDQGASFRIFLPAEQTQLPNKPVSIAAGPVTGSETVLVVDDEVIVRNLARAALERSGFHTLSATGGAEGLEIISKSHIDLVLLDMSMPEMSGRQVLERLRQLRATLPVIVCSGYSEDEIQRQFFGLEISGVLQKPFTNRRLVNAIRSVLDRRQSCGTATDSHSGPK